MLGEVGGCCGDDIPPRQRPKGNSHPNDHVHAVFEHLKDRTNGGTGAAGINRADTAMTSMCKDAKFSVLHSPCASSGLGGNSSWTVTFVKQSLVSRRHVYWANGLPGGKSSKTPAAHRAPRSPTSRGTSTPGSDDQRER